MSRGNRKFLTSSVDEIVKESKISKHSLHNRTPGKLDPEKESRAYYISNLAYCLIQGLSEKYNIGPAGFLEIFLREKAETVLTKEEIAHLEIIAAAMTSRREELISQLLDTQDEEVPVK